MGHPLCSVNFYLIRRHGEILDEGEAAEIELAINVITEREAFLRSLRQDLENQLRKFSLNVVAEI